MALIHCPNCGQTISDKATLCPHYNRKNGNLSATDTVTCAECKAQYNKELSACPACGCPNNTNSPNKKKRKGIVVAAIILSIVLVIGLFGVFVISQGRATVYYNNLETVTYKMLDGAANAEKAGNLIKNVWYNAIYEKRDTVTDKYTLKNGKFVDDFNEALSNLFSDEEFHNSISAIQNNQAEVISLMKQLKNPPKEYEEAYSALKTYYDNYLSMTKMVVSPAGSLQSFSDEFNNADTETINSYEKMKLYLN
ncbi:MAG: hypothetical protein PUC29_02510 [Clostridia bacterium]|nr:hypothetical protein [Clostridia bacterium]